MMAGVMPGVRIGVGPALGLGGETVGVGGLGPASRPSRRPWKGADKFRGSSGVSRAARAKGEQGGVGELCLSKEGAFNRLRGVGPALGWPSSHSESHRCCAWAGGRGGAQ